MTLNDLQWPFYDFTLNFHYYKQTFDKLFLDPEGGSPNATLVVVVVVVVVVISSLKIPKAFLIRSEAQRNFAYTFALIFPTDVRLRFLN